jgi:hypothetical protein
MWYVTWRWRLNKKGTLHLACEVFSVPTRSLRQNALIAKIHAMRKLSLSTLCGAAALAAVL